jgi:hypothetical protein
MSADVSWEEKYDKGEEKKGENMKEEGERQNMKGKLKLKR